MPTTASDRAIYPSLRDRNVLITGGASGIGEGLVEAFVAQGARVLFCDIADEAAAEVVARLAPEAAHTPLYRRCDLTDVAAVQALVAEAESVLGGLHVLVNNAGNDDRHTVEDVSPAYWDDRMAVNLRHMFFAAQAVVPGMRRAGGGVILNFGSISWHLGLKDMPLYQTAKAAIEGMTRALARDLGRNGIRVATIVPGNVQTPVKRNGIRRTERRRSSRRSASTGGSSRRMWPPSSCSWRRTMPGCAPGTAISSMPAGGSQQRGLD